MVEALVIAPDRLRALMLGARSGVYIVGGIVPRLGARSGRKRLSRAGRFRPYLAAIPTCVVTAAVRAFLELAKTLECKE